VHELGELGKHSVDRPEITGLVEAGIRIDTVVGVGLPVFVFNFVDCDRLVDLHLFESHLWRSSDAKRPSPEIVSTAMARHRNLCQHLLL